MKAYRFSVNFKLGLIIAAVAIAVASLGYTHRLVEQIRNREQAAIQLWADAIEYQAQAAAYNPYERQFDRLGVLLARLRDQAPDAAGLTPAELDSLLRAVQWARSMPPDDQLDFVVSKIVIPNPSGVPAVITDVEGETFYMAENVRVNPAWPEERQEARMLQVARRMRDAHDPILIDLGELQQLVQYGESNLVRHLRIFPFAQLLFVSLFILVGYLGFSYVRRSEQSNLWVGMAKEAAHQLGTPISSMMGWLELLRMPNVTDARRLEIANELENDVKRLQRVVNRFSDIGSQPKLEVMNLAEVIDSVSQYIRRRMPQLGKRVELEVDVPTHLEAPLNAELFEWVIENLLKNALDAIETQEGRIRITAYREKNKTYVEVRDTGKGIDKRQWKNIFRPGYSTKKRGWGLGLSLAKRIVEDYHGGHLSLAASRVGEGTTFRITLSDDVLERRKKPSPERRARVPA